MKSFLIFFAVFVVINAVLEENKALIEELANIEKTARDCISVEDKRRDDENPCMYKCALDKLNYEETAGSNTASYRKFCALNTTSIEDKCKRQMEFVYCLHREVQHEVNKIRDNCVEKHGADMQAYRNEPLDTLIKQQSYACFMFCFQRNTGVMNEDLSFNFNDAKRNTPAVQASVEKCTKASEVEESKCSKAASRYYCMEHYFSGY